MTGRSKRRPAYGDGPPNAPVPAHRSWPGCWRGRKPSRAAQRRNWPRELGLPVGQLPRLALRLRPRPNHWAEDVAALAAQVSCSPTAQADLVQRLTADAPSNG